MRAPRLTIRRAVAVFAALSLATLLTGPAEAQSPGPQRHFVSHNPGSAIDTSHWGVVIEGLGLNGCNSRLAQTERDTVTYINTTWIPVITEISPQTCSSVSEYETEISSIISYVESHAGTYAKTQWGGIMLDEESGFGFSVSQLETLNSYVANKMGTTPGVSWWYTEDFSGTNDWSQSAYDGIISNSKAAPQVVTSYMVSLVNHASTSINMVTWSTTYPSGYNSEYLMSSKVNGSALHETWNSGYGSQKGAYESNDYTP